MQKLKKIGLIILVVVILAGFSAVYVKFYFIPMYRKIVFSKVNIDRHNKTIESMNINIFLNKKELNKLKITRAEFEAALKGLPQSERNPEITRNILNFGDSSGVVVKKVSFVKISETSSNSNSLVTNISTESNSKNIIDNSNVQKEKLVIVPLKISLSGDYIKIKKFINLLEEDKRIAQIDNICIDKNKIYDESGQNGVYAELNIVYYYFNSSVNREKPYDFCNKNYGKEDMFK